MQLVARLRELRMCAGLTQRDLARILGVSPSWVAKVELGERRLDVMETVRMAEAIHACPRTVLDEWISEIRSGDRPGR